MKSLEQIVEDTAVELLRISATELPGDVLEGLRRARERTTRACERFGCVYGYLTGGAAVLAADGIRRVRAVYWLEELGMPECLWVFEVEDFGPMLITIDTHGDNLTEEVRKRVMEKKERILKALR